MPRAVIKPGQVVRLKLPDSEPEPGRNKYCLCLCVEESLFFTINTKPYKFAPQETQLLLHKEQLPFLEYDSYLDASKVKQIPVDAVEEGLKHGGVFPVDESALKHIRFIVSRQRYLAKRFLDILCNNFPE